MAAAARFTVVGGGLAGLMTTIKLAEAGHQVDVFSIVPVKRSHSVCAQGGINGAVNTKGEGDSPGDALRRHAATAATSSPTSRPSRGCATRRRASSTCSTAWACRSTAPPRACSTSAASAARCTTAPPSPAPPPASSCSTRSTSRCAATRSRARCTKYEFWEFLGMVQDETAAASASWPWTCARWRSHLPGRRGGAGHRRPGHRLRQVTNSVINTGTAAGARLPGGRASTPTASSSRCTPPPSPARTSCA